MQLKHKPNACCIVPEKRQEVTTEGGLNLNANINKLSDCIDKLKGNAIRVSLFIDPQKKDIEIAKELGADIVEIHTEVLQIILTRTEKFIVAEFDHLNNVSIFAHEIGLEVHAGHGLTFETARVISRINILKELNIGHFIIGEAVFEGLDCVIKIQGYTKQ